LATHGYSKTPLARKLGIKQGYEIVLVNEPSHYDALFSDFPKEVTKVENPKKESIDFIHLFCTTKKELETLPTKFKPLLKKTGMLWVSWPKGSSKIKTEINREAIREYILSIGLVDIKVAAIDADWSGLKFVYRLVDR